MLDPGEGPGGARPPLFFDQNEAQRAEKIFLETTPPLSKGVDDSLPPPLCEGLDLPLNLPHVYGTQLERLETLKRPRFGHCIDFLKVLRFSPVCLYWFGT